VFRRVVVERSLAAVRNAFHLSRTHLTCCTTTAAVAAAAAAAAANDADDDDDDDRMSPADAVSVGVSVSSLHTATALTHADSRVARGVG